MNTLRTNQKVSISELARQIKHQEKALILIPDGNDEYPVIVSQNHQGKIVGKAIHYSVDLKQK